MTVRFQTFPPPVGTASTYPRKQSTRSRGQKAPGEKGGGGVRGTQGFAGQRQRQLLGLGEQR